jgi:hypothetical protein
VNHGIDELRRAVRMLSCVNETFNQQYNASDLLKIVDCWARSTHDISPDQWTEKQLRNAVCMNKAPSWDDKEQPVYK